MDDLLQKETERQRRLLDEARKAVEQEKARLRQGGARKIEPRLDDPVEQDLAASEPRLNPASAVQLPQSQREVPAVSSYIKPAETSQPKVEDFARLRSIPDLRSALIPLEENDDSAVWSKPFSLPRADVEPWLSFLRGYRESCLFPDAASTAQQLRVDAAVQALLELKGIDIRVILEPAVQINGPVEYFDEIPAGASARAENGVHESQLAKAVEKGREMGNHLYDALLGEGYVNLVQAWEKVHGRKPNVSELHFMLTTGRVKPPVELQPVRSDPTESVYQSKIAAGGENKRQEEAPDRKKALRPPASGVLKKLPASQVFKSWPAKFKFADKRKFLFHLSHLVLVCVVVIVYCVVMGVFD